MLLKNLVLIFVVSSTNGNPFTLGDTDTGNIPIAKKAATSNPFPGLIGNIQPQGNNTVINIIAVHVTGGNVSLFFNGLSTTTDPNDRPEESSKQMETLDTEPANDHACLNGSVYKFMYNDVTYNLHLETRNWMQANNICVKEGGHLVVIDSKDEEELLLNMRRQTSNGPFWVGVHSMLRTGEWVTVHDQSLGEVEYVHWASGEPNGSFECVILAMNGLTNQNCENDYQFVCEIAQNH